MSRPVKRTVFRRYVSIKLELPYSEHKYFDFYVHAHFVFCIYSFLCRLDNTHTCKESFQGTQLWEHITFDCVEKNGETCTVRKVSNNSWKVPIHGRGSTPGLHPAILDKHWPFPGEMAVGLAWVCGVNFFRKRGYLWATFNFPIQLP